LYAFTSIIESLIQYFSVIVSVLINNKIIVRLEGGVPSGGSGAEPSEQITLRSSFCSSWTRAKHSW